MISLRGFSFLTIQAMKLSHKSDACFLMPEAFSHQTDDSIFMAKDPSHYCDTVFLIKKQPSLLANDTIFMPIKLSHKSDACFLMPEASSHQADGSIFMTKAPSHYCDTVFLIKTSRRTDKNLLFYANKTSAPKRLSFYDKKTAFAPCK